MSDELFLLVDAKNALWRGETAMPNLNADGKAMGGIFGVLNMLTRVVDGYRPTKLVVCWDDWDSGPAERRKIAATYKKRGEATPEREQASKRVFAQQNRLLKFFRYLDVKQARSPGWEADDVMGTLAKRYAKKGKVFIFTGDKDLLQCIDDNVSVLRTKQDGAFEVEDKHSVAKVYGVNVDQFIEYKALVGDPGDNYAGCPGIGDKGASLILGQFMTLERAFDIAKSDKTAFHQQKHAKLLLEHRKAIEQCKELATINTEAPLVFVKRERDFQKAMRLLHKWKMKTVLTQFGKLRKLSWGDDV